MLDLTSRGLAVIGDDPQATDLRLLMLANRVSALGELDRQAEAIATAREALVLAERAGTPRCHGPSALADQYFSSASGTTLSPSSILRWPARPATCRCLSTG